MPWSIDFALYHCHRLKLFLYRPGVFVPRRALALVLFVIPAAVEQIRRVLGDE